MPGEEGGVEDGRRHHRGNERRQGRIFAPSPKILGTFNQRFMRRKRLSNAMMSMLCGARQAVPPPRCAWVTRGCPRSASSGRQGRSVQRPLPEQPQQTGGRRCRCCGRRPAAQNRCQQCRCEKCSGKNTACAQEQRRAWCAQNGGTATGKWMLMATATRHVNAGMRHGPRPSKSKLQQCVRCEREQLSCWGRRTDSVKLFIVFRQFASNANLESQIVAATHPEQQIAANRWWARRGQRHAASVHSRNY